MRGPVLLFVLIALGGCDLLTDSYMNTDLYGTPGLTTEQMYADYDRMAAIIREVCPFVSVNRQLFGIDTVAVLEERRQDVATVRSDYEFFLLVKRVIQSLQAHHLSIARTPLSYFPAFSLDSIIQTEMYHHEWLEVSYGYEGTGTFLTSSPRYLYLDGAYYTMTSGEFYDPPIPTGSRLISVDGTEINSFINDVLYFTPGLHYDSANSRFYDTGRFLTTLFAYQPGLHAFVYQIPGGETVTLELESNRMTREQHDANLSSPSTTVYGENPYYFPSQNTVYVRLPMMDRDYVREAMERIRSSTLGQPLDRVIIDIRGNPGGSDFAWHDLLAFIMAEDLTLAGATGILDSAILRESYPDVVSTFYADGTPVSYSFLDDTTFLVIEERYTVAHRTDGLGFDGPIYLIVDNIYSAAGSMVKFALTNEQIIVVGRRSGTHLGAGIDPVIFTLPNSRINFRLEPEIDLTNVQTVSDVLHDEVEQLVSLSDSDVMAYLTYTGDRYSEEYLFTIDPYIQHIMLNE